MKRYGRYWLGWSLLPAALLLTGLTHLHAAPELPQPEATIGKKVRSVPLRDSAGKSVSLADYRDRKALVLVFLGTDCPISNSYAGPLSALAGRYRDRGVQFLGINANSQEGRTQIARHAREYRLSFPVLKDEKQRLANQVGARVTPEAFVLDAGRVVRYRGRIDDAYESRTTKRSRVASHDLEAALEAVLAGKPVATPVTQAFGCAIVRPLASTAAANGPTFHRDVLPILQEGCQSCHRPGQVAPFPLLTYADARSWAREIKTFTQSRQMPPWKPVPGHGEFQDERRLSDQQIATLAAWVDAGAPEGDAKDAPPPRQWPTDWMLGKPDLVLTVPEPYAVEATGDDDFRCFVLPTGLTEDRQVVAVEVRPGNPRVVHHVINFLDASGQARKLDEQDPGPGYRTGPGGIGLLPSGTLGGWVPGNFPRFLPQGVGMPLPKNADLVLQVHYHKTGKPEKDQTRIGLYFAREPIRQRLQAIPLGTLAIDIPPGEPRHVVRTSWKLPVTIQALRISPHMHLLGRELKATATLPDGTVEPLVWVKNWDYRWQDTYRYREPVTLPAGTRLDVVATYDNSADNPLNPSDPPKRVTFGEQTTDEMCFAIIEYVQEPGAAVVAPFQWLAELLATAGRAGVPEQAGGGK